MKLLVVTPEPIDAPFLRETLGEEVKGAEVLVLSPATAKTHVSRILAKLHARDRAQIVVIAYETGLVTPRNP